MPDFEAAASLPPDAPTAVFVLGPAGSGKSTVARRLAQSLRAAYLDKDAVAGALVDLVLSEHGEDPGTRESSDYYRARVMPSEYRTLFDTAASNLRLGSPVVLDAPFATFLDRPGFLADATAESGWPPADLVVVEVRTAPHVMHERIAARGLSRDRWKLEHWGEFVSRFGSSACTWTGARRLVVDNSAELDLDPTFQAVLRGRAGG